MTKEEKRQTNRQYYITNRETELLRKAKYYSENKDRIRLSGLGKKSSKNWYSKNRKRKIEYQIGYQKLRLKNDPHFKLRCYLRNRLRISLQKNQNKKNGSAVKDLGCTIPEFKVYIETKFKENMSWQNHCQRGWHLDHVTPLAAFNLENRNKLLKALHYTNYQPLWAEENWSKKDKIINIMIGGN